MLITGIFRPPVLYICHVTIYDNEMNLFLKLALIPAALSVTAAMSEP